MTLIIEVQNETVDRAEYLRAEYLRLAPDEAPHEAATPMFLEEGC